MSDQIVNEGTILNTELGTQLQCTGVRYTEDPEGNRANYEYIFRSVDDLNSEREAQERADRELAEGQERFRLDEEERNKQSTEPTEEGAQS